MMKKIIIALLLLLTAVVLFLFLYMHKGSYFQNNTTEIDSLDCHNENIEIMERVTTEIIPEWDAEVFEGGFIGRECIGLVGYRNKEDHTGRIHYLDLITDAEERIRELELPSEYSTRYIEASDKEIQIIAQSVFDTDNQLQMYSFDYDGKLLNVKSLNELLDTDKRRLIIRDMVCEKNSCTVLTDQELFIIPEKQPCVRITISDSSQYSLLSGNNKSEVLQITDSEIVLYEINKDQLMQKLAIEGYTASEGAKRYNEELIFAAGSHIWKAEEETDLMSRLDDFSDMGVNISDVYKFGEIEDGTIVVITGTQGDSFTLPKVYFTKYVAQKPDPSASENETDTEDIIEEIEANVIYIACLESSEELRRAVSEYNQKSEKVHVYVKEYYDPYQKDITLNEALIRLNAGSERRDCRRYDRSDAALPFIFQEVLC